MMKYAGMSMVEVELVGYCNDEVEYNNAHSSCFYMALGLEEGVGGYEGEVVVVAAVAFDMSACYCNQTKSHHFVGHFVVVDKNGS